MNEYDFIIAGGGVAGLSLACQLVHSAFAGRSILIIDKEHKTRNDRTLCFWASQSTPFDGVVCRTWAEIQVVSETSESIIDLKDYRYEMIRGIDYYEYARHQLAGYPNVQFVYGTIESVEDSTDSASVCVEGQSYSGRWVFDSRFRSSDLHPDGTYHSLQQHFKGWEIETLDPAFDPRIATLFDFRTPQQGELRFFYVLPLSEKRALIELVTLSHEHFDQAFKAYVEGVLRLQHYRVVSEEGGITPLTDYSFPRRAGKHIMNIGIRGGRIKATSGYGFARIQHDSAAIVESLRRRGHPFDVPPDPAFFRLCDSLMLHVMAHQGDRMQSLFTTMFQNNPPGRVLRFLDERTSIFENLALMLSFPPGLFLQALFEIKVLRRV